MLEILVVWYTASELHRRAKARGASGWWAALGPLLWFGGEFSAYFVAGALGHEGWVVYPFALAYGALGLWLAFKSVAAAPVRSLP